MTSAGGKNPLQSQSNLAFSTALALLGFLDVITIQGCRGLEQVFAKMRIAEALALNPQDPWTWYYRGLSLAFAGEPQEAFESVSQALRIKPGLRRAQDLFEQLQCLLGH